MTNVQTQIKKQKHGEQILSYLLEVGNRYKELKKMMVEGIYTSKPKFTQKEINEAREAWIRG